MMDQGGSRTDVSRARLRCMWCFFEWDANAEGFLAHERQCPLEASGSYERWLASQRSDS